MPRSGTNPEWAGLSLVGPEPVAASVTEPVLVPASETAAELLDQAAGGDVGAWSRLYHDHFDAVFSHVCYLTGDAVLSEDLVQDVFARAMTNIVSFDRRSPFLSWVRGIALNVVRMHWRRATTTTRVHQDLERIALVRDEGQRTPERAQVQEQRLRMLYEVLGTIPETLREAFILRELEGTDAQTAAAQLGITPGNLAVRLTRARGRIRKELARRGWLSGGDR